MVEELQLDCGDVIIATSCSLVAGGARQMRRPTLGSRFLCVESVQWRFNASPLYPFVGIYQSYLCGHVVTMHCIATS